MAGGATAVLGKRCPACRHWFYFTEFWRSKAARDGLQSRCRECQSSPAKLARMRRWHRENPEKAKRHGRRSQLRKYGLTEDAYEQLLEKQGGVCAICEKPNRRSKLMAVDHDHVTGAVRGILCQDCNQMIGRAGDDTSVLAAAIRYLDARNERS